jgi:hypothetical protein
MPGKVPARLLPGCPTSGFVEHAGHHCGCNRCCFCGQAHPTQLVIAVGAQVGRAKPRRKERAHAAAL